MRLQKSSRICHWVFLIVHYIKSWDCKNHRTIHHQAAAIGHLNEKRETVHHQAAAIRYSNEERETAHHRAVVLEHFPLCIAICKSSSNSHRTFPIIYCHQITRLQRPSRNATVEKHSQMRRERPYVPIIFKRTKKISGREVQNLIRAGLAGLRETWLREIRTWLDKVSIVGLRNTWLDKVSLVGLRNTWPREIPKVFKEVDERPKRKLAWEYSKFLNEKPKWHLV